MVLVGMRPLAHLDIRRLYYLFLDLVALGIAGQWLLMR
jgi:hypothetical protein